MLPSGVQGRRYTSFHIRPSWGRGVSLQRKGVGLPCFGGERGPSNDAEKPRATGVARPGSRGNPVSGPSECSLRGENGLANRTTCCLSVPRKIPRDERQASQSAGSPDPVVSDERKERFPERFYFRNPSIPAPNSAKSYLTGSEASSVRSEAVISSTAFQSFCFRTSSPSARPIWPVCTSSGR